MAGWGNPTIDKLVETKGQPESVTPRDPQVDEVVGGVKTGRQVPNQAPTYRMLFSDGSYVDFKANQNPDGSSGPREIIGGNALASAKPAADKPRAPSLVAKDNAQKAETEARTKQIEAQTARDQAQAAVQQGQITRQNLAAEAQAYNQRLQAQVALGQLTEAQRSSLLNEWKSGVEAGFSAQRIAIEQQNANTSAGNLGVNRGQLGVSQENADTAREQVVQTAAQNAVTNTLKLLERFMPLNGGADDPFLQKYAAGMNGISGGKTNYQASDFVSKAPDLQAVSQQAAAAAIAHMKGNGMAPATAAATQATTVPTTPTAPAVAPPPALPAQTPAAQMVAGPPPVTAMPEPLPTYTGPQAATVNQ